MKDHKLGYPAAAAHAAEVEDEARGCYLGYYSDPYPLGVPKRVEAVWQRQADDFYATRALDPFETVAHPNPDGSTTTAKGDALKASFRERLFRHLPIEVVDCVRAHNALTTSLPLKAISCKPAPALTGAITAAQAAEQMNAYMRGCEQRRVKGGLGDMVGLPEYTGSITGGPNFQPNSDSPCGALGG